MMNVCFVLNAVSIFKHNNLVLSPLLLSPCSMNKKSLLELYIEYIIEFQKRTRIFNDDNSIIIPIYIVIIDELYDELYD